MPAILLCTLLLCTLMACQTGSPSESQHDKEKTIEPGDRTPATLQILAGDTALGEGDGSSGDPVKARRHYQQALVLAREAREPTTEILALNQLGVLAERRGALKDAENLYKQALTLQQTSGGPGREKLLSLNLARVEFRLGEVDRARERGQPILALAEDDQDWELVARTSFLLGRIAENGSEFEQGASHLRRAATLFDRAGEVRETARCRLALGRCLLGAQDPRAALVHLSPALAGLPETSHTTEHLETLAVMARCYEALEDLQSALALWERAAECCLRQSPSPGISRPILQRTAALAASLRAPRALHWQQVLDQFRP